MALIWQQMRTSSSNLLWGESDGGTDVDVTIADAYHAHVADNLDLTQLHEMAIAGAYHAHAADQIDLSLPGLPLAPHILYVAPFQPWLRVQA